MKSIVKAGHKNPEHHNQLTDFFENDRFLGNDIFNLRFFPATNIIDHEKNYEIELAVPGYKKNDFHVMMDNGILTISAENKSEGEKEANYTRREFSYSSFNRFFTLPANAVSGSVEARYDEGGILKITIAKKPGPNSEKKEIKIR